MEFKEFSNPLETDYDINSSLNQNSEPTKEPTETIYDKQMMAILEEIGLLEDEELKKANISFEEYLTPTRETIIKLKAYRDSLLNPTLENNKDEKTI